MQSYFQTYRKQILFLAAVILVAVVLFIVKNQINSVSTITPVSDVEKKAQFMENLQTAEDQLAQKLEQNANDIPSTIALINALMQQTKYDKAIEVVNKSLESNPDNSDLMQYRSMAYFTKGMFLSQQGNLQEALAVMKKAREVSPDDAPYTKQIDMFIFMLEVKIDPKKAREQKKKQ